MCWPTPLDPAIPQTLKIFQMKTVSLRSNPLKAAFAGILLSATLIDAGDVKAVPCMLNALGACPAFNAGGYTVSNFAIIPSSGWNDTSPFFVDFLNATVLGNTLSIDVLLSPGRSFPVGGTLTYNVSKLGDPILQASSNATVGGVPPIGGGTVNVASAIVGLNGGSLVSTNGAVDSDLFTVPVANTSVSTFFNTTGAGTINSFKVELTSGAPVPPPSLVPGPLPILGAGAAFGFSRRLRRRINTSATA
jgi:hypothetical protein